MLSDVQIPLADGAQMKGVIARPSTSAGPRPGVIVIFEIYGDQPEMRAVVERFADQGYVALMPDLYSVGPKAICVARALGELAGSKSRGRVIDQMDSARAWLAGQDDVDGERIGVIGFCMGGGFALLYAASGAPGLKAAAANYGMVPKDIELLRGACPIVASYGGRDMSLRNDPQRLRDHLEKLDVDHDVKVYDNAGHSFLTQGNHPIGKLVMVPLRLGYVEDAADDAWQRIFSFFGERLGVEA